MSAQEIRNDIIRDNLPKLIKLLTGFSDDDENIRHCEQFAWSIIRNHRNLSTNSHEVKRKIDGIKEKFIVDNYSQYAEQLGLLCTEVIRHPLCVEHYEVDVHWSLLDFLLTLAYNPTGALKRNKHKIVLKPAVVVPEAAEQEKHYWKNILHEDFIELQSFGSGSDSELSDWSDDSGHIDNKNSDTTQSITADTAKAPEAIFATLLNIKPPEKLQHFVLFNTNNAQQYLMENVQNSWWLRGDGAQHTSKSSYNSERTEANFALAYSNFLSETSNNLIRFKAPDICVELCLLREVLWMFHAPQNCHFFKVDVSSGEVRVRDNVAVPSITVHGLANYLEVHFLPYISMMYKLRTFLDFIYANFNPPKTLECYAANLRSLLRPVQQQLLDYEARLLAEADFEIYSLLQLHAHLKESFAMLDATYQVHTRVVLNLNQYPAHITSAYLLASLMNCNANASCATEANLAVSLFLTSVRIFCIIIDTWWTEGRLDDWQHEFIVERSSNRSDQSIVVREFAKNKERAFFLPAHISALITDNKCFRLLLDHSLEAGCTLNLLYEINRIGDLKNACTAIEGKLYNVFIDEVLAHISKFQTEVLPKDKKAEAEDSGIALAVDTLDAATEPVTEQQNNDANICSSLTTTDEFLLLSFTCNMQKNGTQDMVDTHKRPIELNAYEILQQLNASQRTMLPLQELVFNSLSRILKTRIAFANEFVMQLYRTEFGILQHLGNIRKVLLLEASDLMYQFYSKLFTKIESGKTWANPFFLTMQLDDILCSKFNDMSSLFRLEINSAFRCQTNKVFEAVDELIVTYNFTRELSLIITPQNIQQYNTVFRFLLKVKWGIMTLENLQFPRAHKRRVPYSNYELIDLLMRRLEQLRFWMMYAIQSIHFHLMTHVLQSMGEQLDAKITNCTNLKEMTTVHNSYVSTVCEHCFLGDSANAIKLGVEQLLNLTFILRLEWHSCVKHIESNNPLAVDISDSGSSDIDYDSDYLANSQIDAIELTYIRCHQYLANKLNNEVYLKQKAFLSGLSAAFNTSVPY